VADLQLNFVGTATFEGVISGTIEQVSLYTFPKKDIAETAHDVYQKAGVYVLLKPLQGGLRYRVYVGQSDQLGKRLKQHVKDKDKHFTKAIVAFSHTAGLDGHQLNHIEKTLIKFCEYHPLLESTNNTVGNFNSLNRSKQRECDAFLDDMATLMTAMGFGFMKDYVTLSWEKDPDLLNQHYAPEPPNEVTVALKPALAKTVAVANPVKILPITTIDENHLPIEQWPIFEFKGRKKDGRTFHGYLKVHGVKSFELLPHSQTLLENRHSYSSLSSSARDVNDKNINGWVCWKTPEGETLDEFNARHGDPLGRVKTSRKGKGTPNT
jgi:hypothetical protein